MDIDVKIPTKRLVVYSGTKTYTHWDDGASMLVQSGSWRLLSASNSKQQSSTHYICKSLSMVKIARDVTVTKIYKWKPKLIASLKKFMQLLW